jgi:hypothetical protein
MSAEGNVHWGVFGGADALKIIERLGLEVKPGEVHLDQHPTDPQSWLMYAKDEHNACVAFFTGSETAADEIAKGFARQLTNIKKAIAQLRQQTTPNPSNN